MFKRVTDKLVVNQSIYKNLIVFLIIVINAFKTGEVYNLD